jgi:hypothetical protein
MRRLDSQCNSAPRADGGASRFGRRERPRVPSQTRDGDLPVLSAAEDDDDRSAIECGLHQREAVPLAWQRDRETRPIRRVVAMELDG